MHDFLGEGAGAGIDYGDAAIEYGDAHAVPNLIPLSPFGGVLPAPAEPRVPDSPFSGWAGGSVLAACPALDSLAAAAALAASVLGPPVSEVGPPGTLPALALPPQALLSIGRPKTEPAPEPPLETTASAAGGVRDALACPECSQVFVQKLWLLGHRASAHGVQSVDDRAVLLCAHCPAGFLRRTDRTKHTLCVHERRRPHKCDVAGCGSCFFFAKDLKKHNMAVHQRIKPFPCDQCGKRFGKKEHRTCHIRRVHEKLKPYHCIQCSQSFSSKYNARNHRKTAVHRKSVAEKAAAHRPLLGQT